MVYGVKDRPKPGRLILFALQQLLAILAATIAVPMIVNSTAGSELSISAALFGAGVGTIVYLLFTRFKSPVFLGSSFAFINSMVAAFAGAYTATLGYLGILLGAVFAGLVYVIIAVIVKYAGVKWIEKIMPAVVIGPTVALIGLSLAGSAVSQFAGGVQVSGDYFMDVSGILSVICGIVTLAVTIISSVYGKKLMKMIPFVLGISAGYVLASIFTAFSYIPGAESMRLIDFEYYFSLSNIEWYPNFTFIKLFDGNFGDASQIGSYIGTIAVAYIPVAFVTFAEHLADHKNISSIIETDLLKDPGLSRTLLGDGVGSMAGALFGGCPNTTYGESVGCVALSGNASVITILVTAGMAILASFIGPFVALLSSIPGCVMGGVCVALYGFIAVSGLKMIQKVDLGDNKNLFTVSVILITGVGGMSLFFGSYDPVTDTKVGVTITAIAMALILGILCNVLVNIKSKKNKGDEQLVIEEVAEIPEKPAAESASKTSSESATVKDESAEEKQ